MPDVKARVTGRRTSPARVAGYVPGWVLPIAILGALLVLVPLVAMGTRVDWANFGTLVSSPSALAAVGLSLRTSLAATVWCVLLGVPMAIVLARMDFPFKALARTLVLVPLVLPPVVGGLALLYAFGRRGLLGGAFSFLGIDIAFSTTAVVLAQTFVALPFMVLTLESALRAQGAAYEGVAATLGARRGYAFRTVTLPLMWPALVAGTVLCFARALGEFGATITFAGSLEGVTRTVPLEIYLQREVDPDAAVALSLLLIIIALVIVGFAYRRPSGRSER
ncbi:ABC transporter permease [Demequina aurantiaca]|uniref:ABC transporter permease n=1 Tax=Demequina aurantiaca TaxID=676200 RepID=UPI0007806AEE|nr:ABC transporter permease [Demequina aurantiaca]